MTSRKVICFSSGRYRETGLFHGFFSKSELHSGYGLNDRYVLNDIYALIEFNDGSCRLIRCDEISFIKEEQENK